MAGLHPPVRVRQADRHQTSDPPQNAVDLFQLDWTKYAKAAPFKRNEIILAALRMGVMAFPGNGIQPISPIKANKTGILV